MAISAASAVVDPLADVQQIQGNVLRPFGGRHQAFLALSFRHDRAGARAWLGAAAARVAGTDDVPARGETRRAAPPSMLNVGLTATGLVLLHPETAGHLAGYDAFWRTPLGTRLDDEGRLTTAAALLGDVGPSDPSTWVVGGLGAPVDALLTVAANDDRSIEDAVRREEQAAEEAGLTVLHVQWGEVLRDERGRRVEHFGFTDGISQPSVRGFTDAGQTRPGSPVIAAGEFILGSPGERRPQSWAPRPVPPSWMRGGSFQVFRRLRQDATGWWERLARLAAEEGGTVEDAAARALGRRLDGSPLAPGADPAEQNDFSFAGDDDGKHTPLFAHIRKVNPRDDTVFRDRLHKMLRRGIPFGPRFDRNAPDDRERGLVFNVYVASIEDQFEFVQRRWANDPGFPASTLAKYGRVAADPPRVDGLDPVLSDSPEAAAERLPEDVVRQIPKPAYGGFVTTTGAVYAFAPPLAALHRLASDESLDR